MDFAGRYKHPRPNLIGWWPTARRASLEEVTGWMASPDVDQLKLEDQAQLAAIYKVAKQNRRLRNIAAGAGVCLTFILAAVSCANSAELVRIRDCYDGDTCRTTTGEKIRLACIDTPELRGKRADPVPAKAARDYLRSLVVGQQVGIRRITTDRYGRTVGELFADGSNVQQRLVASGHADIYWKYAHQCPWTR